MELIGVGLIALVLGLWLGGRTNRVLAVQPPLASASAHAQDRASYLFVLRRELANILIWRDPDLFLQLYKRLHIECSGIQSWTREAVSKRFDQLAKKYPNYPDFDRIGTRDYVLYYDGLMSDQELEEAYSDNVIFTALLIASQPDWAYFHATSAEELEHLEAYVRKIKDTQFKSKLIQAVRERYIWQRASSDDSNFESPDCSVRPIHDYTFSLGVQLKGTNEFGVYSLFVDDEKGVAHHGYYRSDSKFEQREHLNAVNELIEEDRLRFPDPSSRRTQVWS